MTAPVPTKPSSDGQVAEAMRVLQTRAPDVLNAIDDGVFFLDADARAIFVNEAAARILGFTNREMLGRPMHELTHHHYADGSVFPAEECPILSSVHDGIQQRVGGDTFWRKDGTPIAVDYTSIPLKEGRTIVGVVVTFRDISNQQRVEEQSLRLRREREALQAAEQAREALRESEARFRFMAEALPVQVWTALPDGRLDFVTNQVADYFGVPMDQVISDGWRDVVHPEDLPGVAERWMHSLSTGEPYKVEFRLRAADGSYRWHLARALAQRDESGAVVRWFGTNTDMEDEKRAVRTASSEG
jgi:PAS domain S-box-containing protein